MIFDMDMETLPREELEALQLRRLKTQAERVYANVKFYRRKFDEAGIKPGDIRTLADLRKLPFTEKQDLRDNYPFGLFAVPRDHVVRVHASSGTTGKSTVVGYTRRDISNWADAHGPLASCCAGANRGDIVHNAYGYGLFTGGLGAHYGAEKPGGHHRAHLRRRHHGRQVTLLQGFRGHGHLLHPLLHAASCTTRPPRKGVDIRELPLKVGMLRGRALDRARCADDIEKAMGDQGPQHLRPVRGAWVPACPWSAIQAQSGLHIFEDHFLPGDHRSRTPARSVPRGARWANWSSPP